MAVQTQIQARRGTAASWTSTNPTLAAGETGYETDTGKFKIGNGSTAWASLAYATNGAAVSPLTTKGDLYTYSTADTRLPVGANGETLVADSSTATGLRYTANFAAGLNKVINGDFSVNQRNFTSTVNDNTFTFDRWRTYSSGTDQTYSAQTFTPGAAPVAGYEGQSFAQIATIGAAGKFAIYSYRIEDVRTFAGQTMTVSFWAKANSGTPKISLAPAQFFGTGGSATVTPTAQIVTISTSWTRYSLTFSMPSLSGKTIGTGSYLALEWTFNNDYNVNIGQQTNTFQFWGVKAEAGSVATAFQTATGTIQGELAACQRYYFRNAYNGTGTGNYIYLGDGQATATTTADIRVNFPVTMRNEPQAVDFSGLIFGIWANTIAPPVTAITIYNSRRSSNLCILQVTASTASLTAGNAYYLLGNGSGTSYVGLSAEL